MVAPTDDRPRLVAGLRLLRVVGRGGEGEVWEARDGRGRPRALKLIRPDALVDPEQVGVRGRHLVRIDHPALVAVHRCGVLAGGHLDGWGFVEMDLVEGSSLHSAPADPSLLDRLAPLAEALDLLHAGYWSDGLPLVHRDVKPSNILARPTGDVVLVDPSTLRGVDAAVLTRIGTPLFAAPEVVTGRLGPAADVYSFAATVVALVTGARGNALGDLLDDPSGLDLPDGVRRALSPLPADRPASCRAVLSGARRVVGPGEDEGWQPVLRGPDDGAGAAGERGALDDEAWDDEAWDDEAWDDEAWDDEAWDDDVRDEPRDHTLVDFDARQLWAPLPPAPAPAPWPAPPGPSPWQDPPSAPPWSPRPLWPWFGVLVAAAVVALAAPQLGVPRWQPLIVAGALHVGAHLAAGRRLVPALVVPPAAWGFLLAERAAPPGRLRTWTAATVTGALCATALGLARILVPDVLSRVSTTVGAASPDLAAVGVVAGLALAGLAAVAPTAGGAGLRLALLPAWLVGAVAFLAAAVVGVVPALLLLRPAAPLRLAGRTVASSAELVRGPPQPR